MAQWRKVITSGSTANLAALQVDNLTSGQVVIGAGAGNLTTTAINGTGNIVATTNASGLTHSGSFSGSFRGDGSGLTGVVATNPNSLTNGEGISVFSYNGLTSQTVSVSGAVDLTNNIITKWDNTNNKFAVSSITDDGTTVSGTTSIKFTGASSALTGSFTGSFAGTLTGTASFASNGGVTSFNTRTGAVTLQASDISGLGAGIISSSAFTASWASFAVTASYVNGNIFTSTNVATSASYASTAGQTVASLTAGNGITTFTYNGSSAQTVTVGAGALIGVGAGLTSVNTSSLTTNQIPKYSSNALAGSNISDTGTQVQIAAGASSGLSVAAGGISITGNSTFVNNVTVQGDLTVAGTASFQNTQNLLIGDRFAALASGSTTLVDGGIIVVGSTSAAAGMSGSAFYLEVGTGTDTGTYGRFAVAPNVHVSASAVTVDEWVVTAKQSTTAPGANNPTWGGNTNNAAGNMWVDTTAGNIYIWA
jgi:hypothetical protein